MKFSYRTEHNAKSIAAFWGRELDSALTPYTVNAASDDLTTLFIMDILGWPFNDINAIVRDLADIKTSNLLVRLNSPGGDPIDTFSLYHALKNHPAKVTVRIEAMAASAASFLALSGDEVQAYPSSFMMIHNSWALAIGNKFELRDTADILEKIDTNMQDIYIAKTKIGKKEMFDIMKAESWFSAKEAKEKGFIDTILDGKPAKAEFDLSIFGAMPGGLEIDDNNNDDDEPAIRKYEKALRDVGASKNVAKTILARGLKFANDEAEKDEYDAKELVEYLTIASGLKKLTRIMKPHETT